MTNSGTEIQDVDRALWRPPGNVTLRSLAPKYDEGEHGGYVRHLEDAIKHAKNRNIALTGRYGSGKSSILDEFEKNHKADTVRISINTLGPDGDDESLTNRIQKELVKQLIYRAKPGALRSSRFARVAPLTKVRALLEAFGLTVVVGALLWLAGVRFDITGISSNNDTPVRWASGIAFGVLVLLVVWLLRWLVGDRIVSQVTAAGTTVTLESGPDTYFDKYLDEVVAFFDAVEPKFVIFEDLDRFDDPQIFDSLRELNTLINDSTKWKGGDKPLRFIYAIKDSLFEQLGTEPDPADDEDDDSAESDTEGNSAPNARAESEKVVDPAIAAVQRANRTKFFELVIPVVPFISHRNARDLLVGALRDLGFPDETVPRRLLDLVARHATDMRLLLNICNEFVVFSERLLWVKTPAPGMTSGDLFALVAYKNFHLADFEAVPQRVSTLDDLERHLREVVRACVEDRENRRRTLVRTGTAARTRTQNAQTLGTQLLTYCRATRDGANNPVLKFHVGSTEYDENAVSGFEFWENLAREGAVKITSQRPGYSPVQLVNFSREQLAVTFPEGMRSATWANLDENEHRDKIQSIDTDVAFLRGASYVALGKRPEFEHNGKTFSQLIDDTLKSELARDLVRRGFLNRNYAEYSATFYGAFLGVDVAFFYNHSVQPNQIYVDYQFKSDGSIANLLEQVPADFTSSISVYNVAIVSYLVRFDVARARNVAAFLVSDFSSDAQTFLDAFLNVPEAPHRKFTELLVKHPWPKVFDHIAAHDGIPDEETRFALFDTALQHAQSPQKYTFGDAAQNYLTQHFEQFTAVTGEQTQERATNTFSFATRAALVVTDLDAVDARLRSLVVAAKSYELTVGNLRAALDITGSVSLDAVRTNPNVWQYCRDNITQYVSAVREDEDTTSIIEGATVLTEVLNDQKDMWSAEDLQSVLALCDSSAALSTIDQVPAETWPKLVDARLVAANSANLTSYTDANGIDRHLARFLVPSAGAPVTIEIAEGVSEAERGNLATRLLNTDPSLLSADHRVRLATELKLPAGTIATDAITPTQDDLLAQALTAKVLPDTADTFRHFIAAGWKPVEKAFAASTDVANFLNPTLLDGHVAAFLSSSAVPQPLRLAVVDNLDKYTNDGDTAALKAAGKLAQDQGVKLPLSEVRRVASATQDPDLVLPQLVKNTPTPDEIIDTLVLLEAPYSELRNSVGHEFDLPSASSAQTLFTRLESAGKVEIMKKPLRGRKVRVLF